MNILEVKIVKHMPELKASEQPTIAIVTSLFCEKEAVDAMIEEKTTYVKYKTEGCYKINLDTFHFIILFLWALICLPFEWAILICQIQLKTTSFFCWYRRISSIYIGENRKVQSCFNESIS